jgi:hypothetical protein
MLMAPSLTDAEQRKLRAFRRAAEKVFYAYKPLHTSSMKSNIGGTGDTDLFPEAEFALLLLGLRLTYMPKEPGFFDATNEILATYGDAETQETATVLKARWDQVLTGGFDLIFIEGTGTPGEKQYQYGPKELLDHWMYTEYFHQDENRMPHMERLERLGDHSRHLLHVMVWQLARLVVGQDIFVADILGEPRLPVEQIWGQAPE